MVEIWVETQNGQIYQVELNNRRNNVEDLANNDFYLLDLWLKTIIKNNLSDHYE